LTAAGIKWPEQMTRRGRDVIHIQPEPEAIDRYLASVGLDDATG